MLTILASFAQEESRSISENVKWGTRKKYAKGEGMNTPDHVLGYQYDREHKRYVIIPEEAEIVREIYQLYLDGMSTGDILKKLNAEGKRSTFGSLFDHSRIHCILTNEIYTGNRLLQKTYVESYLTKKSRKNRGELPQYFCEDLHEAIIDQETFDRVQTEHKRRGEFYAKRYWGYRRKNGKYVIYPQEAEIVRWIFQRYLERAPFSQIAAELKERGIKATRQSEFKDYKVRYIVQSDFYDPDNPAVDVPLLDRETYQKVQAEHEFREKHLPRNIQNGTVSVSNKRAFGYQYDDEQRRYMIVPEEAEIVREIFTLYLGGMSAPDIARKLNADGKRSALGGLFDGCKINTLLDSEIYVGDLRIYKTFVDGDKIKRNNGEIPQYLLTDVHEAIIDRETFRKVQELRKKTAINWKSYIFGYRLVDLQYVIDPEKAEIVRAIFKMYLEHEGDSIIARAMNGQGYKGAKGGTFDDKIIHRITMNEAYAPNHPNVTEPIFDTETYEKIKAERKYRAAHKYAKGMRNRILGYKRIDNSFFIDPQSAEAVRLAIEMYLRRMMLKDIAVALNERAYKTVSGQEFTVVVVKNIVKSDQYYPGYSGPDNIAEPIFDAETHEKVKAERLYRKTHNVRKGLKLK